MLNASRQIKKLKTCLKIYHQVRNYSRTTSRTPVIRIRQEQLFNKIIRHFGPQLDPAMAAVPLSSVYDIGYHTESGALIISNKGATLFSAAPRSETPYLVRHIGICVYMPDLGIEMVNVGLAGNVYQNTVVLRGESACTPSFLFGSQRCNCAHQWQLVQELAAHFNQTRPPATDNGHDFEQWVQNQTKYDHYRHLFRQPGPGFVMMHLDCQNGMGSGYTPNDFASDLYSRASLRHRGEYTSEQVHQTTMAGGFTAIGLPPDPRQQAGLKGYRIISIVLDYLEISKKIVLLSNNPFKIRVLRDAGYAVSRLPFYGEVNVAGEQEARERGSEFHHMDISGKFVSFQSDFNRLVGEIKTVAGKEDICSSKSAV